LERGMQRLSNSISIIICGIAAYFALHWGTDALMILASPLHGMDNAAFTHIVNGFGRLFNLNQDGIVVCAAAFGAAKLGVASIFTLYLVRRLTGIAGEEPDHDLLEAGLVLVVVTIAALAAPLVFDEAASVLNQFRVPLWLVGLAATLSMVERVARSDEPSRLHTWAAQARAIPATLPRPRGNVSALRWNQLRREANLDCRR
jgi:hypothetical protein